MGCLPVERRWGLRAGQLGLMNLAAGRNDLTRKCGAGWVGGSGSAGVGLPGWGTYSSGVAASFSQRNRGW